MDLGGHHSNPRGRRLKSLLEDALAERVSGARRPVSVAVRERANSTPALGLGLSRHDRRTRGSRKTDAGPSHPRRRIARGRSCAVEHPQGGADPSAVMLGLVGRAR